MNLTTAIGFVNVLYNLNSTPPGSSEEDYLIWTSILNVAINVWEQEEGMLWNELYVKLSDASDGDKATVTGDWSYIVPTDFVFPNSSYVWIGSGTNKNVFKIIKQSEKQLYENNSDNWCYFLMDGTPTLEFNPNCNVPAGTLFYDYYKTAKQMATGSDVIEMSDPMFAVEYVVNELNKDTGDQSAGLIASQKLEGMRTKNMMSSPEQIDSALNEIEDGMGIITNTKRSFL